MPYLRGFRTIVYMMLLNNVLVPAVTLTTSHQREHLPTKTQKVLSLTATSQTSGKYDNAAISVCTCGTVSEALCVGETTDIFTWNTTGGDGKSGLLQWVPPSDSRPVDLSFKPIGTDNVEAAFFGGGGSQAVAVAFDSDTQENMVFWFQEPELADRGINNALFACNSTGIGGQYDMISYIDPLYWPVPAGCDAVDVRMTEM